jgi:hypothetical protein
MYAVYNPKLILGDFTFISKDDQFTENELKAKGVANEFIVGTINATQLTDKVVHVTSMLPAPAPVPDGPRIKLLDIWEDLEEEARVSEYGT